MQDPVLCPAWSDSVEEKNGKPVKQQLKGVTVVVVRCIYCACSSAHIFCVVDAQSSCHSVSSAKALNEAQSTDPNLQNHPLRHSSFIHGC